MLYRIENNEPYDLDLEVLNQGLDTLATRHPQFTWYFNEWKNVFRNTYANNLDSFDSYYDEVYSHKIIIGSTEFYINFDVSKANKITSSFPSHNISIDLLLEHLDNFHLVFHNHKIKDKPVLIIPFPVNYLDHCILIDGNHRLSAKIKSKHTSIDVIAITDTENLLSIVPFPFERAYYTYALDSIYLNNIINNVVPRFNLHQSLLSRYL